MLGSYLIHGVDDFVVQPRTLVNDVTVFNDQIQRLYPPVRRWTCGRWRDAVYAYWRRLALCSSRYRRLTAGILITRRMLLFVTRGWFYYGPDDFCRRNFIRPDTFCSSVGYNFWGILSCMTPADRAESSDTSRSRKWGIVDTVAVMLPQAIIIISSIVRSGGIPFSPCLNVPLFVPCQCKHTRRAGESMIDRVDYTHVPAEASNDSGQSLAI